MSSVDRAIAIVDRMATLAEAGGAPDVARALAHAATMLADDPAAGARELNAMFGGMGSLNDVILYANGQPLVADNREFDSLRSELFDLTVALR